MEFGFEPKWTGKASGGFERESKMVFTHSKTTLAFEYRLDLPVAR